jgi:anti-sigma B factor antagonist
MAGVPTLVTEPDSGFELTVLDLDPLRAAIRAVGGFDVAAREALAEILGQHENARRRIVRLDLSHVTFLDSSCLEVLVASHHRFLELHGLLVLTGVGGSVARLLKITGLDARLFIVPADQDPFGSVPMAHAARQSTVSTSGPLVSASFEDLMAVADRLEPSGDRDREPRAERTRAAALPDHACVTTTSSEAVS